MGSESIFDDGPFDADSVRSLRDRTRTGPTAKSGQTGRPGGNLTGDGVDSFGYDTENHLLSTSALGNTIAYTYDPLGRRASKTVNSTVTAYVDAGDEEIAEYDNSGTLLARYVYGADPSAPVATITVSGSTSTTAFDHKDGLGSIVALSDGGTGDMTDSYTYDPYGESASLTGNAFRFAGMRLDPESGLYYDRARYYAPALGRFLQTDPIGTNGGINLYAYVGNDPIDLVDPRGYAAEAVGEAFNTGMGQYAETSISLAQMQIQYDQEHPYEAAFNLVAALPIAAPEDALIKGGSFIFPSSRALGSALEASGVVRPAETAAHHIVAGLASEAAPARSVLQNFGIGINDAANGVFLPASTAAANATNAAVHSTLHTSTYYQAVNEALAAATTRQQALDILATIGQGLSSGGLP